MDFFSQSVFENIDDFVKILNNSHLKSFQLMPFMGIKVMGIIFFYSENFSCVYGSDPIHIFQLLLNLFPFSRKAFHPCFYNYSHKYVPKC